MDIPVARSDPLLALRSSVGLRPEVGGSRPALVEEAAEQRRDERVEDDLCAAAERTVSEGSFPKPRSSCKSTIDDEQLT